MKKIGFIAVIVLFATSAHAQTGMPQELTCTEKAFNFSFSVGTKWKFVEPKMGPVEASTYQPDNIPALALKINNVTPETYLLPVAKMAVPQQSYIPASYINSFKTSLPDINFTPPLNYTLLKPGVTANLNRQFVF